jgi:serine/threonine protein kinase/tetratricopeptide (TPR) repeat protein
MALERGAHLGPYEILTKLGEGGMGEIYRARDTRLGREVAIKLLSEDLDLSGTHLQRFEAEARAASSLNHPNIVTVYDVGLDEDRPFIVMELIHGRTLRELLASGDRLPLKEIVELAAQAAEALAKAHSAGIVHRDLKPENLMVTADGYVKILDFGLAKLNPALADIEPASAQISRVDTLAADTGARPAESKTGSLMGTIGYMAPEQVESSQVDYRADQFAFGVILYELVTGRRAFGGSSRAAILNAIISQEPPSVSDLNPTLPPPLRWIIERCLAKDPAKRYVSTTDLARELRTLSSHLDETTSQATDHGIERPRRTTRPVGARRWLTISLLTICVLAALILARPLIRHFRSTLPATKQLVILPFHNATGDSKDQVLCDGLIETLTTKLTQLSSARKSYWVIPASEVRAEHLNSAAQAAKKFGATLAITGSLQRTGNMLRLTANLVDTQSLRQLRAISFDTPTEDLPHLQDGLVRRVAQMLSVQIGDSEAKLIHAGTTSSSTAYEAYLRGRGYLLDYPSADSLDNAVRSFQQALQRDPDYALAYAGLGEAYWRQYDLSHDTSMVSLARRNCERALELNDLLAPVHITLGILHRGTGEPKKAIEDFDEALRLDPNNARAVLEKAHTLQKLDRNEEAEKTYRRAINLRPSYWGGYNQLGAFYFGIGQYARAAAQFRRVTELAPGNARGFNNLGGTLQMLGKYDAAEKALNRALQLEPSADGYSNLGTMLFARGRYADAVPYFEKATKLSQHDYQVWLNLAAAYYWAPGMRPKATPTYRKAAELARKQAGVNPRDLHIQTDLADCEVMLGEKASARRRIESVLSHQPDDPSILTTAASIFEELGRRDEALHWIGAAIAAGASRRDVEVDPSLKRLTTDPRYEKLFVQAQSPLPQAAEH